jgi:hypothetical protein
MLDGSMGLHARWLYGFTCQMVLWPHMLDGSMALHVDGCNNLFKTLIDVSPTYII